MYIDWFHGLIFIGQPRQSHEYFRAEPPFQDGRYHSEPQPSWGPPSEQYRPSPAPYGSSGSYPQQQNQGQYINSYGTGYDEFPRRPPPRGPPGDPYYVPPMYGYEYPVPSVPQPRGLEGMNQYHSQFASQRGDYVDSFGKPLPQNVSINRTYNAPDIGFQNQDFTRAMDDRATYLANQADPYTANRSRVGWPGDHSDKFHNRKYFVPDLGGQQTYIPRDLSGQPGDSSDRHLNRSNFKNPNFGYRTDTYSQQPFKIDPNERSIRSWQSGTRPLASSGLQSGPFIPTDTGGRSPKLYETENQDHIHFTASRNDSKWPPSQSFPSQNDQARPSQSIPSTESNSIQSEE